MFPSQTQRMLMLVVLVVGLAWWWMVGGLVAGDGASTTSLWEARGGVVWGGLWLVVGGAVAAALAVFVSGSGNPLSGVFTLAMTFTLVAAGAVNQGVESPHANGVREFMWRADAAGELNSVYPRLIMETALWVGVWLVVFYLLETTQRRMRRKLPDRLRSEHLGGTMNLLSLDSRSALAALITAGVGALLVVVLVPVGDERQVIGALVLAFTIAAMVGQMIAPQDRPMLVLLVPAGVSAVGYGLGWMQYGRGDLGGSDSINHGLLAMLYGGDLPGVMLALPMHYLSAGVVGCAMGIGLAQAIEKAKLHTLEA